MGATYRKEAAVAHIRGLVDADSEQIVSLWLLAAEPIFASFEKVLGHQIYTLVYSDWRRRQKEIVEKVCQNKGIVTLVAESDDRVVGFIGYEIRGETGEVMLLAVHPDYQNQGIGTDLNKSALEKMKTAGAKYAEVATGGDPGHAPARRSYEKAGYIPLPLVRYYKAL